MHRKHLLVVLTLIVTVLFVQTVQAQTRRPVGIKISPTDIDPDTLSADINVTLNTYTGAYMTYYGSVVTFDYGYLGDRCLSASGWGYPATLVYPDINAVEWGDGAGTVDGTLIPMVTGTPGTFRGSFSHTFPNEQTRTAKAATVNFFLGPNTPNNTYLNQVTAGRPYLLQPGDTFQTYASYWGTTYTWSVATQTYYGAPFTDSVAIGLYNTAPISFRGGIPVLSTIGLLALAAILAGAGVIVLRRVQ